MKASKPMGGTSAIRNLRKNKDYKERDEVKSLSPGLDNSEKNINKSTVIHKSFFNKFNDDFDDQDI